MTTARPEPPSRTAVPNRRPAGKAPEVGVTFNVGGSAVTNCVTVLKRTR